MSKHKAEANCNIYALFQFVFWFGKNYLRKHMSKHKAEADCCMYGLSQKVVCLK